MVVKISNLDDLVTCLEHSLSQSPSAAGARLKSHREIADSLNLNHSQVRSSLQRLEKKGILLRKPRIGTYIRRLPSFVNPKESPAIDPKLLLKDLGNESTAAPMKVTSSLQIGFWGKLESQIESDQKILAGITMAANRRGHKLIVHSGFEDRDRHSDRINCDLMNFIKNDPCDGYLVLSEWESLFTSTFKNQTVPVVYFMLGSTGINKDPMILLDTCSAIERAMSIFLHQGYKKIAMIGLDRKNEFEAEYFEYKKCVELLNLDYSNMVFCDLNYEDIYTKIQKLLTGNNIPEAIYVNDDYILNGVSRAMKELKIVPGKDVAVITLSNRDIRLPDDQNWSRLEFNRDYFCQLLVETLLDILQGGNSDPESIKLQARWIKGDTHIL